ncbi:MAG: hypothetical protein JWR69_253 [Pedosphaera sp.]|nr:hypothetical protein [Pedosphaera sp.]
MTTRKSDPAENRSDREMVITRVFDAPRELVWAAWTDPKQALLWWGPKGFTTTTHEMEVKPGGVWRFIMHGPDGTDYPNKITYREVLRHERLVYAHTGEREDEPGQFVTTVTFEEQGGKTKLTMRATFRTAAERDEVVKKHHALEGGNQTLARLAEHLEALAPAERVLILTRIFAAPRELVFKAWIDPKHMAKWWGPKGFTNPVCELDARPGGAILIHMQGPDAAAHPMRGTFHEIVEPERLVFTSTAFEDKQGIPQLEVFTTITFAEQDGGTKLTLRVVVVRSTPELAAALAGMEQGWSESLVRLAECVSKIA